MAVIKISSQPFVANVFNLAISPVPAASIQVETYTVKGLTPEMLVAVQSPTLDAGLVIINHRITAKDTVEVTYWNVTTGTITPGTKPVFVITL